MQRWTQAKNCVDLKCVQTCCYWICKCRRATSGHQSIVGNKLELQPQIINCNVWTSIHMFGHKFGHKFRKQTTCITKRDARQILVELSQTIGFILTMFIRWHLSKSYMLGLAVTPIWSGSFSSLSKFAQTYLKLAGPTAQCCTALACVVRGVRCVVCVCVCACVCVCVCVCACVSVCVGSIQKFQFIDRRLS